MPGVEMDPSSENAANSQSQPTSNPPHRSPLLENLETEESLMCIIPLPKAFRLSTLPGTATPVAPQPGPSAPPSQSHAASARRRGRKRIPPMTQETVKRALVKLARVKAEATVRLSEAAERYYQTLEGILGTLQRIERTISANAGFPRAEQPEHSS